MLGYRSGSIHSYWPDESLVCSTPEMHGSVSSFAYQGTNSHAVLGMTCPMSCTAPQTWLWQRRRLWYQISSYPLLSQFSRGQSGTATATALANIRMQCSLQRPALSYLLQHSVCGQALVAPTVLLEMAAAAGQLLWSQEEINNPVALPLWSSSNRHCYWMALLVPR